MTLQEKQSNLARDLGRFKDPQERLTHLVQVGRKSPSLPANLRTSEARLEGCLSNLWLHSDFHDGACYFVTDSDSAVVKGLATLISELFSGLEPAEILKSDLALLREAGLWQHLTPNRRTGLSRLLDHIHEFARAHLPK